MKNYGMMRPVESHCGCVPECPSMEREYALAMAYVPWQCFDAVYEPDKALEVGTVFPELDKPFLAAGRCGRL